MAKKPKVEVDESLVKQVIAGQLPITTKVTRVIPEQIPSGTATDAIPAEPPSVPEIDTEKIPDETPSVPAAQEPRRRRTPPLSDYERMFLTPVEYGIRATLYVNASTKRKILEILKRIGGERLSATSYVDNILQHHIETFRDDINRLDRTPNVNALLDDELVGSLQTGTLDKGDIIRRLAQTIPLGQVGRGVGIRWEDPVIPRYNGQRMQSVMCSPAPGVETEAARQTIAEQIEDIPLPTGYSIRWDGEKGARDQTMYWLFKQVPLAVVLIIAVLILLFGDYRKPTIVLCCIPLLAVGIVGAMLLTGKTFDFCAIVGALGLMGMLIKNCIVLLDEIGKRCSGDTDLIAGLVVSAQSRLRPVMMASLTTILGMIPLLGDAMFGSMAATIMGGLFFSTIATLLFLPILYALFFKIKTK